MNTLRTGDVAKRANIHVNTVRFYERVGLIAKVPRNKNNHRIFSERHLYQVLVLRYLFLDEWPGKAVRKASYGIVEAMKQWDIPLALSQTQIYLRVIEQEIEKAKTAVNVIRSWNRQPMKNEYSVKLDTKQTAAKIGSTHETIRNWERNGLITIPRQGKNRSRYFTQKELDRLRVIYLLRQAQFSIAAIYRALKLLDQGKGVDAVESLELPDHHSVYTTGDHLLEALALTRNKAVELLALLQDIYI